MTGQCYARNYGMKPYTCCMRRADHSGPHWDAYRNAWLPGEDQPHFKRTRRTIRFFVEADVSRCSDALAEKVRAECQAALEAVLEANEIGYEVHRSPWHPVPSGGWTELAGSR